MSTDSSNGESEERKRMEKEDRVPVLAEVVTDVSLREGSQQAVDYRDAPVETKIALLERSVAAGIVHAEITAFGAGPWFRDAAALIAGALSLPERVKLRVLYFNAEGLSRLLATDPRIGREGIFHTAVTANYRWKNYRQRSVAHAVEKMKRLFPLFQAHGLAFDTLVLSCLWGESHEAVSEAKAIEFCGTLVEAAEREGFPVRRLTLADTEGRATPDAIGERTGAFRRAWPEKILRAHLHPPKWSAAECVEAALEGGIEEWEGAWGGVGGSPFADAPGGNLDIRWLVRLWRRRGWPTGLDPEGIEAIVDFLRATIEREVEEIPLGDGEE